MAVDDPSVIDFIGVNRDTGEADLVITDGLAWDAPQEHLLILQKKINVYLGFIEGGELLHQYPAARGKAVRIEVVFRCSPPAEGVRFLCRARDAIQRGGWQFSWRVFETPKNETFDL